MNDHIFVLGAGMSGLSTALVLQALGYKCTMLAEYVPNARGNSDPSRVPTGYAMASAYPHLCKTGNLEELTRLSQAVFKALNDEKDSGVSIYKMFEVFEQEQPLPYLGDWRLNFQAFAGRVEELKDTINPPARPGATRLWGWCFDTYFADMEIYLAYLWSLFRAQNGVFKQVKITADSVFEETQGAMIINCLGVGAIDVFNDRSRHNIQRGKQVLVKDAPVTKMGNLPVAFNYTPVADVFRRNETEPEYIHFFPRQDGWLLGQTREPGSFDADGNWVGEAVQAEQRLIGDELIPAPIIDLNDQILQAWLGVSIGDRPLDGRTGYRYYRDPEGAGTRLEPEVIDGHLVMHNYGHGGSGITISWGCAINAVRALFKAGNLSAGAGDQTIVLNKAIKGALSQEVVSA